MVDKIKDAPTLGGLDVVQPKTITRRMAILILSASGDGKTTLAATAPGKKLWISFDSDATACLGPRDDIVEVSDVVAVEMCDQHGG